MEEISNGRKGGGESCRRQHRGRSKLQMCPSVAEEAADLSLGGVSRTRNQRCWRELRTRAATMIASDLFVDSRGSIKAICRRRRELCIEVAMAEFLLLFQKAKVSLLLHQSKWLPCLPLQPLMVRLKIDPRDLALLCQKFEVDAFLTGACTCSVGGTDYGSVRIGAFMGRRMIKSEATSLLSNSLANVNVSQQVDGMNSDDYEEHGIELLKAEASLDYLCNLSTHR
ncbi:hypothetical protein BHE74_00044570 [Ensete ventricosum]|nr:hypothetical protein BHE74_00044570 [Ensete ventricosum]